MPNHPPVRHAGFHILIRIKEKEEIKTKKLPNPFRILVPDRIGFLKEYNYHIYISLIYLIHTHRLSIKDIIGLAVYFRDSLKEFKLKTSPILNF